MDQSSPYSTFNSLIYSLVKLGQAALGLSILLMLILLLVLTTAAYYRLLMLILLLVLTTAAYYR